MKKFLLTIAILPLLTLISSCGSSLDYENTEEVKEYLVNHAYKANENDVEVVLHFFKNGEGSLSAYLNGAPAGSDQIFSYKIGETTDDNGVYIETSLGQMQLEDDGKISYLYNGNWFFFREWEN
jgi:hypothetical protein